MYLFIIFIIFIISIISIISIIFGIVRISIISGQKGGARGEAGDITKPMTYNFLSPNYYIEPILRTKIGVTINHAFLKESYNERLEIIEDKPSIIIEKLRNNEIDMAIVAENRLLNVPTDNLEFICGIYPAVASFIVSNDFPIHDIGELRGTIAVSAPLDKYTAEEILKYHNMSNDVVLVTDEDLVNNYGVKYAAYFSFIKHPSKLFREITEKLPSHLLTMNKINDGTYHIRDEEREFYARYKIYRKTMLDLMSWQRYYPYLQQNSYNRGALYVPSIKARYVILGNSKTPDKAVKHILHSVLKNLHTMKIDIQDSSYNLLVKKYNLRARKVFSSLGL